MQVAATLCKRAELSNSQIGIHATALSLSEIGLGSALHAFHIPFAGTFLSLNQIFLLTRALSMTSEKSRTFSPFSISTSAALFKCLAPIGKKVTPMLGICIQGLLYNFGILCFGNTLLGRLTGGILASIWSFCQPLLLYGFLFGASLFQAIEQFAWLEGLFYRLVIVKIIAASLIVLLTPLLPPSRFEQYLHRLSCMAKSNIPSSISQHPIRQIVSDLCKPLFLFSLFMTAFFLYFSKGISNALVWGVLRPLAIGFFCFFLTRLPFFERWLKHGI